MGECLGEGGGCYSGSSGVACQAMEEEGTAYIVIFLQRFARRREVNNTALGT